MSHHFHQLVLYFHFSPATCFSHKPVAEFGTFGSVGSLSLHRFLILFHSPREPRFVDVLVFTICPVCCFLFDAGENLPISPDEPLWVWSVRGVRMWTDGFFSFSLLFVERNFKLWDWRFPVIFFLISSYTVVHFICPVIKTRGVHEETPTALLYCKV